MVSLAETSYADDPPSPSTNSACDGSALDFDTPRRTALVEGKIDRGDICYLPRPLSPSPVGLGSWRDNEGPYAMASRRQHKDVVVKPAPPPSIKYLAATELPSASLSVHAERDPPFLALSVAHTLLARIRRNSYAARTPVVRPYLATFLEYVCGTDKKTGKPRFEPVILSSARKWNVLSMLAAVDLVQAIKLDVEPGTGRINANNYQLDYDQGDVLSKIVSREKLGLARADFKADIPVVKNLRKVLVAPFERRGKNGLAPPEVSFMENIDCCIACDVILVDEDEGASVSFPTFPALPLFASRVLTATLQAQHPYNHLVIPPFLLHDSDYPTGIDHFVPWEERHLTDSALLKTPTALELDEDHPLADDTALLASIYFLERLRRESNPGSAIRAGFFDKIREEIKVNIRAVEGREPDEKDVEEELASRGRAICERLEIIVDRRWRHDWRIKMLEKEGRKVVDGAWLLSTFLPTSSSAFSLH